MCGLLSTASFAAPSLGHCLKVCVCVYFVPCRPFFRLLFMYLSLTMLLRQIYKNRIVSKKVNTPPPPPLHSIAPRPPRTERNTLDLRGMTLSEAQDDCDMFFSTSIMDDVDGVYLLHGHGTGVLKAGIRRVRKLCS